MELGTHLYTMHGIHNAGDTPSVAAMVHWPLPAILKLCCENLFRRLLNHVSQLHSLCRVGYLMKRVHWVSYLSASLYFRVNETSLEGTVLYKARATVGHGHCCLATGCSRGHQIADRLLLTPVMKDFWCTELSIVTLRWNLRLANRGKGPPAPNRKEAGFCRDDDIQLELMCTDFFFVISLGSITRNAWHSTQFGRKIIWHVKKYDFSCITRYPRNITPEILIAAFSYICHCLNCFMLSASYVVTTACPRLWLPMWTGRFPDVEVLANGVVTKLTRGYPASALDSGAANNPPLWRNKVRCYECYPDRRCALFSVTARRYWLFVARRFETM